MADHQYFKITIHSKEGVLSTIGEAIAQGHPQIGYVLSPSLNNNDYKEIHNSIITENISRGRDDFIVNPRPPQQQDLPVITVSSHKEFGQARELYDNASVVRVPRSLRENTRRAIMSTASLNGIGLIQFD